MKQSEKERLLNNAYKQKVENLKFDLLQFGFLPISKGFFPLGIEYQKIQFTKYLRLQFVLFNLALIINLKIYKNATN